jgi:hypothetical protein
LRVVHLQTFVSKARVSGLFKTWQNIDDIDVVFIDSARGHSADTVVRIWQISCSNCFPGNGYSG